MYLCLRFYLVGKYDLTRFVSATDKFYVGGRIYWVCDNGNNGVMNSEVWHPSALAIMTTTRLLLTLLISASTFPNKYYDSDYTIRRNIDEHKNGLLSFTLDHDCEGHS